MAKTIDRKILEQYVAGKLTPAMKINVEDGLRISADLRSMLEEIEGEAKIIEAVVDSQAIRLPDKEEERITSKVLGDLGTTLE